MEEKKKIVELIQSYLENKSSEQELNELLDLFNNETYQGQIETLLYKYWYSNPEFQQKLDKQELDQMLDTIHHQINIKENEQTKLFQKAVHYASRVAAILFIPLLISSFWYILNNSTYNSNDSMIVLETPVGSKLKTTLPDGTEVWQNGGSTIKYPDKFTKKNRHVELTGEAYFHVASDKRHPFLVKTVDGTVKVTGTRFNVTCFPDDISTTVVLEEGEVACQFLNTEKEVVLKPSEKLVFYKDSSKYLKQKADVEKYVSWTSGKLIFRNDPLSDVVVKLNRWFNADVILEDPDGELGKHSFTLTIQNETIDQVLAYITHAANLKIKLEEQESVKNNAIVKMKYIITK